MKTINELKIAIENERANSAWGRAVKIYALELLEELEEQESKTNEFKLSGSPADKKLLLNGACDWSEYSYGGCSLIYDHHIAVRVCTPSEFKRCKEGDRNPNQRETWLDVQSRALYQACNMIMRLARRA